MKSEDMNYSSNIFEEVDQYIGELLAPEDEILQRIKENNSNEGLPDIAVTASQGKFLQILAESVGARRILELGTLGGYSTAWMARALPADGYLLSLEFDPHHAKVARENMKLAGLSDIVEIREGHALDILAQLVTAGEKPFDFIFIDADKPPYPEYFQYALQLSRPGTMIVCDNVIREGKVLDPNSPDDKVQGVRRLNELLSREPRVSATILQTVGAKDHDGMALALVL
jgi:predicted O-methyltransferase YrrM